MGIGRFTGSRLGIGELWKWVRMQWARGVVQQKRAERGREATSLPGYFSRAGLVIPSPQGWKLQQSLDQARDVRS